MNAEQLFETTLDENRRILKQVQLKDIDEDATQETISILMGSIVEPRREFIQANALKVNNLDV